MRVVGALAWVCVLFVGCAVGGAGGDNTGTDAGNKPDSSTKTDSGGPTDSGGGPKDTGGPQPDAGPCGGQCLGTQSTCCNNSCVDITQDTNNCGGCGIPCSGTSCCAGNCVNTMGSDTANCGGCGVTCNGTCVNGTCQTQGGSCTLDKGTCSHSPCTTGGALQDGCDPELVTTLVCDVDGLSQCCTSSWDSSCVSDASFWEANSCIGQGC